MMVRSLISRAIALLIFGLLTWGVFVLVVAPLAAWRERALSERADAVQDIASIEGRIQNLQSEVEEVRFDAADRLVWTVSTIGATTAEIQRKISETSEAQGLIPRSIAPAGIKELTIGRGASFRYEAQAELNEVLEFLVKLEGLRPALVVQSASIRRIASGSSPTKYPIILAQLEIVAPLGAEEADQ